jgi:hypothetical protein
MTNFNRAHGMRVLADILEEREAERKSEKGGAIGFYMNDWFHYKRDTPDAVVDINNMPSACGTSLCVAGFATIEAGWSINVKKAAARYADPEVTYISPKGDKQTNLPRWEVIGREYLGMDEAEAHILFMAADDNGKWALEILERLVKGDDISREEWIEYASHAGTDVSEFDGWEREEEEESCTCYACQ